MLIRLYDQLCFVKFRDLCRVNFIVNLNKQFILKTKKGHSIDHQKGSDAYFIVLVQKAILFFVPEIEITALQKKNKKKNVKTFSLINMKGGKQSNEAIEKVTLSTIQAFEMLKELQAGKITLYIFIFALC